METIPIDSLDDPRLDVYRSLKQTNRTRYDSLFVVEGMTVTQRLIESDYRLHSILATPQRLDEIVSTVPSDATIYIVQKALASELVGFRFHLGVLATGYRRDTLVPEAVSDDGPSLMLFGDGIIDQQNVGMLIRIGSAFGADAVLFGPGCADPFSRRVMRVSMGNGLFMPVHESSDAADTITRLKKAGYRICGTVLSDEADELSQTSFQSRSVVVFGNETHGISDSVLSRCDDKLTVSMLNGTDSVNVAIAAGIFGYAYRLQYPAPGDNEQTV